MKRCYIVNRTQLHLYLRFGQGPKPDVAVILIETRPKDGDIARRMHLPPTLGHVAKVSDLVPPAYHLPSITAAIAQGKTIAAASAVRGISWQSGQDDEEDHIILIQTLN